MAFNERRIKEVVEEIDLNTEAEIKHRAWLTSMEVYMAAKKAEAEAAELKA